ncbi:ATP-binding protein [Arthrobacter antibioticus]|uniref:ATP-binding protein n=1 Tax=Arthrobacter sp. H35-MC1 TaxID=3046203 RepID=UPI0024B9E6CD|nr:ATP-binding protein [Arthrobacter sp. H35-MC1]MDJ0318606.1 ATP-binding protein [Arthrobacter sp. H35-MC1]
MGIFSNIIKHHKTSRGLTGLGGGRWGKVPQPPQWYSSSTQLCGIYPFSAGTSRPNVGTPLGRDMNVNTAVCGDMKTWYDAGLISSPSMMLFGLNGNGKSSMALRFMYSMAARGIIPAAFDPIKNEYGEAIEAIGGNRFSFGPGKPDHINGLDLGSLGDAAAEIGGEIGDQLYALAIDKAVDTVILFTQINRGSNKPLSDIEETVLEELVKVVIHTVKDPWMPDLLQAFDHVPPDVLEISGCDTATAFHAEFKGLGQSLQALIKGRMGALLLGRKSVRIPLGNPGGFCFDTSSIPESNSKMLSAAMLGTWNIGFSAMDAHWELAEFERRKAAEAAACGDFYEPKMRWGSYFAIQDEFWYPMRACEGIIDRADRVGRTNRGQGVSELKITHSPKDFLSLPNAKDRETAKGFAQRCGMLGLMALTLDDLDALSAVQPLNAREVATVAGFNVPPSWAQKPAADGSPTPPPGAGKILLKVPGRVGIAVQMTLTQIEDEKHVTDARSRISTTPESLVA